MAYKPKNVPKISEEIYCYINLLSDKHLIWIMISLGPENQGTKIYRTENGKVPCMQEPVLGHREMVVITTQRKHSSELAVFTKAKKKKCYKYIEV